MISEQRKNYLFLLPHQDDEVFFAPLLIDLQRKKNVDIEVLFLTSGGPIRKRESENYLRRICGISSEKVKFLGDLNAWEDGKLHLSFRDLMEELARSYSLEKNITFVSPTLEGGHQDHDTTFFAVRTHLESNTSSSMFYCGSLYRAVSKKWPLFWVLCPPAVNKKVNTIKVDLGFIDRIRILWGIRLFPSQWRSWAGLFLPSLIMICFSRQFIYANGLEVENSEVPNNGKILYSLRKVSTFEEVTNAIKSTR